jgi:hypothetical protein
MVELRTLGVEGFLASVAPGSEHDPIPAPSCRFPFAAFPTGHDTHPGITPARAFNKPASRSLENVRDLRKVEPFAEHRMWSQGRIFLPKSGVMGAFRAHQDTAPGLVLGRKAQHEFPIEIGDLGSEHRSEDKSGVRFQGLPKPCVRVDPPDPSERLIISGHVRIFYESLPLKRYSFRSKSKGEDDAVTLE